MSTWVYLCARTVPLCCASGKAVCAQRRQAALREMCLICGGALVGNEGWARARAASLRRARGVTRTV